MIHSMGEYWADEYRDYYSDRITGRSGTWVNFTIGTENRPASGPRAVLMSAKVDIEHGLDEAPSTEQIYDLKIHYRGRERVLNLDRLANDTKAKILDRINDVLSRWPL